MSTDRHPVAEHVLHTVQNVADLHSRSEQAVTHHQRIIERITSTMGRPGTVYLVCLLVVGWMVSNGAAVALRRVPLDPPPFSGLATATSIVALITTMLILTSQNRQARSAEQRSQLDLHVNLMAEEKTGKIIQLLEELRRDMPGVKDRIDPVANAMTRTVDPVEVMDAFERTLESDAAADQRESAESALARVGPGR
jgi:uncharacterized membrane protein